MRYNKDMTEQRGSKEGATVKTAEDPREFMEAFYESKFYKDAYEDFFKGKKLASDVTDEEKRQAFLESEKAKFALVDFGVFDTQLRYNPGMYPIGSQQALGIYIDSVGDMYKQMREQRTPEEVEALDSLRFAYHGVAAEQLVKDGYCS